MDLFELLLPKNRLVNPNKHKRSECPQLHVKKCPGCGRSCWCYMSKKEIDKERKSRRD